MFSVGTCFLFSMVFLVSGFVIIWDGYWSGSSTTFLRIRIQGNDTDPDPDQQHCSGPAMLWRGLCFSGVRDLGGADGHETGQPLELQHPPGRQHGEPHQGLSAKFFLPIDVNCGSRFKLDLYSSTVWIRIHTVNNKINLRQKVQVTLQRLNHDYTFLPVPIFYIRF